MGKQEKSVMEEELDAVVQEQEVKIVPKPKLETAVYNRSQRQRDSNLRRLKAVFNGNYKAGQKLPDGWKVSGFNLDKVNKKKPVEKKEEKGLSQVDRVLAKMKIRG